MQQEPPPGQRPQVGIREADPELVRPDSRDMLRCLACGHRCRIPEGQAGVCRVRHNRDGHLEVPFGAVHALAVDPIEKKPLFHVLPGAQTLSFGMLGCDLHCAYCQNWTSSQALRDPTAGGTLTEISADDIVEAARSRGCRAVVSTYNEPLITAEWARAVFQRAHAEGLLCALVTNGNTTPEVIDHLRPWISAANVDLKSFDDRRYRSLGMPLATVLGGIDDLLARGVWVEVTTLVVPGFNDSDAELRAIARHLAARSRDLPWHVTAFWPQYKMSDTPPTPTDSLARARGIGLEAGLRHVYAGNRPGELAGAEHTLCPGCGATLIARRGFRVEANRIPDGACPDCARRVAGLWTHPTGTPCT